MTFTTANLPHRLPADACRPWPEQVVAVAPAAAAVAIIAAAAASGATPLG